MNVFKSNSLAGVLVFMLLSGCVGYAPNDRMIGESKDTVIQTLGKPSSELKSADGSILIFPRGPKGKHTFFVYLNEGGNVARWSQVLDEKNFALIKPDMHRDEVVSIIGESKDTYGLARDRGYVWNYRFVNAQCFWFNIEFTKENRVRSAGYSMPPECRPKLR